MVPFPRNQQVWKEDIKTLKRTMLNEQVSVKQQKQITAEDAQKLVQGMREHLAAASGEHNGPSSSTSKTSTMPLALGASSPATADTLVDDEMRSMAPTTPLVLHNRAPHIPPSPMPLTAPEPTTHLEDAEYIAAMQTLVVNIHKSNTDWNKKSREIHIAAAKCKGHAHTRDSALLHQMVELNKMGDKLDKSLASVEEKHVMGIFIDITEQVQCRQTMAELTKIATDASKIKLLMRGSFTVQPRLREGADRSPPRRPFTPHCSLKRIMLPAKDNRRP